MIKLLFMFAVMAANAARAEDFRSRSTAVGIAASCPDAPLTGPCPSVPNTIPVEIIGDYPHSQIFRSNDSGLYAKVALFEDFADGGGEVLGANIGGVLLPVLRTYAWTAAGEAGRFSVGFGSASALYAYTFYGPEAVAFPLVGNLDFNIHFLPINFADPFGPGSFPYSAGAVEVRLAVFTPEFYSGQFLFPEAIACGVGGVVASNMTSITRGGFASGGLPQFVSATVDASTRCDGSPLMLNPGDRFYLHAFVSAYSQRGAIVDATNTFRVDLATGTPDTLRQQILGGLEISNVPEPASWAMMIIGFGFVGTTARLQARRHAFQA